MSMADYKRVPVRLSYDNPEHVRIMDILDDLNLDVHKSRNQFIINAITFYVEAINNDTLTYTDERKQREMEEKFVTHDDMQEMMDKFSVKIKTELHEEMIKLLASIVVSSGGNTGIPVSTAGDVIKEEVSVSENAVSDHEDLAETLSRYDNVMQQVMNWSED